MVLQCMCVCEVEWTTVKGMAPIYSGVSSYVGLERHYIWHACVVRLACMPPLVSLVGCTRDKCNLLDWPLVGIYFMWKKMRPRSDYKFVEYMEVWKIFCCAWSNAICYNKS